MQIHIFNNWFVIISIDFASYFALLDGFRSIKLHGDNVDSRCFTKRKSGSWLPPATWKKAGYVQMFRHSWSSAAHQIQRKTYLEKYWWSSANLLVALVCPEDPTICLSDSRLFLFFHRPWYYCMLHASREISSPGSICSSWVDIMLHWKSDWNICMSITLWCIILTF